MQSRRISCSPPKEEKTFVSVWWEPSGPLIGTVMVKGVGEDAGCWMTSCLMDSFFSQRKRRVIWWEEGTGRRVSKILENWWSLRGTGYFFWTQRQFQTRMSCGSKDEFVLLVYCLPGWFSPASLSKLSIIAEFYLLFLLGLGFHWAAVAKENRVCLRGISSVQSLSRVRLSATP